MKPLQINVDFKSHPKRDDAFESKTIRPLEGNLQSLGSFLPNDGEPFLVTKGQSQKGFVTFKPCKESVSKRKNHCVASKSNLINQQYNLPLYLKRLPATNFS